MIRRGVSTTALAGAARLHKSNVSRLLNGTRSAAITEETAYLIADALGVDVDVISSPTDDPLMSPRIRPASIPAGCAP